VSNIRAYAAYFLSSVFSIVVFFLYATLANHPDLHKKYINNIVIQGMQIAEGIIYVFAFFSILYSMGLFLRSRNKEFGMLTLLGISRRQLMSMVFLENMLLGIAALAVSIVMGLIGSKLFLLLGTAVIDIPDLPFYIPMQALLITCGSFLVLFLLISAGTTLFIGRNTVNALLKGTEHIKKEPRSSVVLSVFATLCLIAAYVLALWFPSAVRTISGGYGALILIAVIVLTAIGTYFLFSQLSIFVIRALKKKRTFFWHGTHMLWLSDLAYSMKANARLLFAVSMILAVSFTATGTLALGRSIIKPNTMPFSFSLASSQDIFPLAQQMSTKLEQTLHEHHISYDSASSL